MVTVPVVTARLELAELLNKVAYRDERVVITRQGKPIAALVPLHTLSILDKLFSVLDEEKVRSVLERESDAGDLTEEELMRQLGIAVKD